MGFSLVGNSGDQTTTTNTTVQTATSNSNPQADQSQSGAGAFSVILDPITAFSNDQQFDPSITDYYAPLNIVSNGTALGDSALNTLNSLFKTATVAGQPVSTGTTSILSSLLSGNAVYYILGAIVLLFLAHHPKG